MADARTWIDRLALLPHPEGGYYREVYRSHEQVPGAALPARYTGDRAFATGIYFLLTSAAFSAFHKVNSDEGWHYYTGTAPIRIYFVSEEGEMIKQDLGPDIDAGQVFQFVVPANHWFAAEVIGEDGFGLVGCTVAPGFDFEDFQLAERQTLVDEFPQHEALMTRLTRL